MTKTKLLVVVLVFGLAGITYASDSIQDKHAKHEKAACCVAGAACCDGGSCCSAGKAHEACATNKDGEDCCKPGAACCNGGSCCEKKAEAQKGAAKPSKQTKQAKAEDGCCAGGGCSTKHKSHS